VSPAGASLPGMDSADAIRHGGWRLRWIACKLTRQRAQERMKQVIVVNERLRLPRGKLAAQVAHAAVGAQLTANPNATASWLALGMPKVVFAGRSVEHLLELEALARSAGLPVLLVQDAGRTVVPEGTVICVGIGPATEEELAAITSELKLLR